MSTQQPTRIAPVDPKNLTPEQQPVAERIAAARGKLPGPFTALLHIPELADRVQNLGAYLRYQGNLDRDVAEIAIIVAAKHWGSAYCWNAHEPIARRAGAPDAVIKIIESGESFDSMPDRYRVACEYARELITSGHVNDALFESTAAVLGREGTIELTVLVGYYCLISMTLNALGWQ